MEKQGQHAAHAVATTKRSLLWSFVLTGGFFATELIVGFAINSVAVIADAFHNFSAAAGVGIALVAIVLAAKPPSPTRTFGFLRVEVFAAWINGVLLVGMAGLIVYKGIQNLLNPTHVASTPMFILAVAGLIIGGIPAVLLYQKQKTDLNARGAFWHVMETVFGSAAVLAAAITISFTGWMQADVVFGMLLAPVLVVASWRIIAESTRTLLDLTPRGLDLLHVKEQIERVPHVERVHHMHAWNITSEKRVFSAHVKVTSLAESRETLGQISELLYDQFNISLSTIQLEERCLDLEKAGEMDFL
jgi:cobalt-zinc-cadmium efflux system protein